LTAGDAVVRFVPPLIVTEADVDRAVAIVDEALRTVRQ
jgi:4-aminobutyrate aminotransferase-like enzyme